MQPAWYISPPEYANPKKTPNPLLSSMKALIYITLAYIVGLVVAVDFVRPPREAEEPMARFNPGVLGKLRLHFYQTDEPVPGLEPDDSSDDEDFPEEPGTPKYD